MESWRLITTWGADPGFNMGLDEALLLDPEEPPTARFYTWRPDTLSLGYFQRAADVAQRARAGALVRRITGGGAIHHVRELTFSLCAGAEHPLFQGPLRESYRRVHEALIAALQEAGVAARLRADLALASERPDTGMCFHASTDLDVVWDGRKGVGSAQRRSGGRVLHHGSIKLGPSALDEGVAELAGFDAARLAPLLARAFQEHLGLALAAGVPGPALRERARELGRRYLDPAFVGRR